MGWLKRSTKFSNFKVWFKNRRARFRHNRLPNTEYQRIPAEFGHGKLKTSKPASPELHPSPPMPSSASADSSSSQSAASLSPSLSISLPKTENYTEVPFDAPQLQQIKDFEKSFYSMSFQGHGNFWPASSKPTILNDQILNVGFRLANSPLLPSALLPSIIRCSDASKLCCNLWLPTAYDNAPNLPELLSQPCGLYQSLRS